MNALSIKLFNQRGANYIFLYTYVYNQNQSMHSINQWKCFIRCSRSYTCIYNQSVNVVSIKQSYKAIYVGIYGLMIYVNAPSMKLFYQLINQCGVNETVIADDHAIHICMQIGFNEICITNQSMHYQWNCFTSWSRSHTYIYNQSVNAVSMKLSYQMIKLYIHVCTYDLMTFVHKVGWP
jgi:hypothetical protein